MNQKKSPEDSSGDQSDVPSRQPAKPTQPEAEPVAEVGGRDGPEPTRYGDWEKNGRCIDF